jgi:hypothetical protein
MKIVVIGGTGLIGSKVVACLNEEDHETVAASPDTGVNTLTGEGLAEVLEGASVVIDVSNSPSFEDDAVMEFFTTSTTNLLTAEVDAGVRHHVALSVVGTERLTESGYFRAKIAQEMLIFARDPRRWPAAAVVRGEQRFPARSRCFYAAALIPKRPLAMQKVVGSNPISRSPHSQAVTAGPRYSGAGGQIALRGTPGVHPHQPPTAWPLASASKTRLSLGESGPRGRLGRTSRSRGRRGRKFAGPPQPSAPSVRQLRSRCAPHALAGRRRCGGAGIGLPTR